MHRPSPAHRVYSRTPGSPCMQRGAIHVMSNTRRQFLADSSKLLAAAGLVGLGPVAQSASAVATRRSSANDGIVLGLIGARGQGMADLRQALKQTGVRCGAL